MNNLRRVEEIIQGRPTSDGAGVKLTRVFGGGDPARFDPFLMLDEFGSNEATDYIGGFPPHPHRGFETVSYMLEGHMQHQDHLGNVGELRSGDVQWMTAGSGIVHSEMPQQQDGRLHGFQLWLNLPARAKMQAPSYSDIPAADIPVYPRNFGHIKAIAGTLQGLNPLAGRVHRPVTDPIYLDVVIDRTPAMDCFDIPAGYTALVYVYEGSIRIGETTVGTSRLARLSKEGSVQISALAPARFLLLAGKPLKEPVVQYGPFVMNTREEIEQALMEYRDGTFAQSRA